MNNLRYGNVVSIWIPKEKKFIKAQEDGSLSVDGQDRGQGGSFLLLNPNDLKSTDEIKSGDDVSILSYYNKYLVCEADGEIHVNRDDLTSWEVFRVHKYNDETSLGNKFLIQDNTSHTIFSLKSHTGKFLTSNGSGTLNASLYHSDPNPFSGLSHNTAFLCYVNECADFYDRVSLGDRSDESFCLNEGQSLSNIGSDKAGYVSLEGRGASIKVCAYPKVKKYNEERQLTEFYPIDISEISYFKAYYKREGLWYNVCREFITWSDDHCGMISGLKSKKKYKVKVFYKTRNGSEQYLDTVTVRID